MIDDLKPYSEYKDSGIPWAERVPSHWKVEPGFAAFREKQEKNTGLVEKRVLSLSYGRIVVKPDDKLHGLVPESFETYQIINPGDIIIRSTDLQNDWNSLRVGLVRDRGIITSAYICLKMAGPLMPEYCYLQLHALDLLKVFYGMGSGLRQNLDFSDFKRMPILVPTLEEQNALVKFFAHINRQIEHYIGTKKKLISLLDEQKQVITHRVVTRGLSNSIRFKSSGTSGLGDIPEHWDVAPLKSLCFIQSGITLGKTYLTETLVEFPYLRVANVQAGRVELKVVKTLKLPEHEARRSMLKVGDVLMTEGGDPDKLGRGCVWEGQISPCLHQNHVFAVRPDKHRLSPYFLAAVLGSEYSKTYFLRTAKQTTNLASTNKTTIGQFRVPLPEITEQERILQYLEMELKPINEARTRAQFEIDLMREYRTRLTADVVLGKLDVREGAARLSDEGLTGELDLSDSSGEEIEGIELEDTSPREDYE